MTARTLSVGTEVLRSIQNQRVCVAHAIINQTVLPYGKGIDERLATRAINVAVQPDAEGSPARLRAAENHGASGARLFSRSSALGWKKPPKRRPTRCSQLVGLLS